MNDTEKNGQTENINEIKFDENVYPPSDDSYMIVETIKNMTGRNVVNVLDMCCGTGILGIYTLDNFKDSINQLYFVDISEHALKYAKLNFDNYKSNVTKNENHVLNCKTNYVHSDLFEGLEKLNVKFDLILFNPPYLPTSKNETAKYKIHKHEIETALAGGVNGREIIDRFIEHVAGYLKENGIILMLDSSLDDTDMTIKKLQERGLKTTILSKQKFFFEELSVILAETKFKKIR